MRALCTVLAQCHHSGDDLVQNTSWKDLPAPCAALTAPAAGETSSKTWFMETSVQQLASQIRGAFIYFFFLQAIIDWSQLLWFLVALRSPCEALEQHLCWAVSHDTVAHSDLGPCQSIPSKSSLKKLTALHLDDCRTELQNIYLFIYLSLSDWILLFWMKVGFVMFCHANVKCYLLQTLNSPLPPSLSL